MIRVPSVLDFLRKAWGIYRRYYLLNFTYSTLLSFVTFPRHDSRGRCPCTITRSTFETTPPTINKGPSRCVSPAVAPYIPFAFSSKMLMIFEASGPLAGAPLGLGIERSASPFGFLGLRLRSISWLIDGPCLPRNRRGVFGRVVMNCSQSEW
jgi:hypothetical protein